jgi:hypothetical protein
MRDVPRKQCGEWANSRSSNHNPIDGEVLKPNKLVVDRAEDEAKAMENQ